MRTVKLIKIKNEFALIVPEAIIKLYSLKEGQLFNLETKENNNFHKFLFLTYATQIK